MWSHAWRRASAGPTEPSLNLDLAESVCPTEPLLAGPTEHFGLIGYTMACHSLIGWRWSALVATGQHWSARVGTCRHSSALAGGRWSAWVGAGQHWPSLATIGRRWSALGGFGYTMTRHSLTGHAMTYHRLNFWVSSSLGRTCSTVRQVDEPSDKEFLDEERHSQRHCVRWQVFFCSSW